MNLKKLTLAVTILALTSACSKRDEGRTRPEVKPPTAPTTSPNPNSSSPDLVSKDNQRREGKRQELVTTNPDISRAPLLRKPRIDDVIAVNLSAQAQKESLEGLKLSVVMKINSQPVSVKFMSEKKMAALGQYQPLTLIDKTQKLTAEARCLVSCADVLVRVRRDNGEETAFIFKDAELTMLPDLEKDPNSNRLIKTSRILEVGYSVVDALEHMEKSMQGRKLIVDKMVSENAANEELRRASELLMTILADVSAASNDVYELSRVATRNVVATPEQLSSADQKLFKASQSIALAGSLVKQEPMASEMQAEVNTINQLRPKIQLMTQLLSKN